MTETFLWTERVPLHPRKASAHKRRQHRTRLRHEVTRRVPGVRDVVVWPRFYGDTGPVPAVVVQLAAFGEDGALLPAPAAQLRQVAALLCAAFPTTGWRTARRWDITCPEVFEDLGMAAPLAGAPALTFPHATPTWTEAA